MARNVVTTTISLPRKVAKDLGTMSERQGMTTSELIRDALRVYQRSHTGGMTAQSWRDLQQKLRALSRAGKSKNLSNLIASDRASH